MADFDPDAFFGKLPTATPTKGAKGDDFDPDAFFGPVGGTSSPSEPAATKEEPAFGSRKFFEEGMLGRFGKGLGQRAAMLTMTPEQRKYMEQQEQDELSKMGASAKQGLSRLYQDPLGVATDIGAAISNTAQEMYHNPGKTTVGFLKSLVQDPEFLLLGGGGLTATAGTLTAKMGKASQIAAKVLASGAEGAAQMAAMEAAAQTVERKPYDPVAIGTQAAVGGVFSAAIHGAKETYTGIRGEPKPKEVPPPPSDATTPSGQTTLDLEAAKARAQARTVERAKAPLTEAGMKNTETGVELRMGPKHDPIKKSELKDDPNWKEGFFDKNGTFHEREAAVDQAKRAGQLPEDFVAKAPEGERQGLHSGDMREAGIKEFDVTKEQPAGVPKEPDEPKTRAEHFKEVQDLEDRLYIEENKVEQDAHLLSPEELVTKNKGLADKRAQVEEMRKNAPEAIVKDKVKPTSEELHEILAGAKTVGDGLKAFVEGKYGGEGTRWLAEKLLSFDRVAKTSLTLDYNNALRPSEGSIKGKEWSGAYYGDSQTIHLYDTARTNTFLHEAVHAAAGHILDAGTHHSVKVLKRLYEHAFEKTSPENYKLWKEGKLTQEQAYDKYREEAGDKGHYGLKNVDEFVSESFTKPSFVNHLQSIEGVERVGSKGLWTEFKDTIKSMLDPKTHEQNKFLDQVLEHGARVMESETKVKTDTAKAKPSAAEEHLTEEAPKVVKEIDKIDPRSMPNKEAMLEHATDLYEKYGEEQALKFIEDFNKDQSQRSIPVRGKLEDVLHKIKTFMTADSSEFNTWYREAKKQGVSKEQTREWFDMRERGEELPPEGKAVHEAYDKEQKALYDKAVAMDLPVGPEYKSGQSRVRLYDTRDVTKNFKDMVKEFFSDKSPMTEKMAEQADSAIERKVYQLDDGRVIEIHRIQEDAKIPMKDKDGKTTFRNVRKGTEVWEWNNGKKKMIGHTEDLNFKMGDKIKVIGKDGKGLGEQTMVDGKVGDIETHSPYRYLHDSMASQALAIMGLRKMVREAELLTNLKNNADFKKVAHSPDQPIETIPKGWKTPESIEKIPQLRGYHFDPKTAAIIEDFARVYDPTILSKMTAALVKNMMLNPIPHMFNEAMHLFNARGFTGWVNPIRGLEFVRTARKAWNDVGNQTQVYRDAMKAGGSMLGADPRNKMFDAIIKENSKEMFKQPEMQRSLGQLAKKLGTTVGDLYNGISNKSQQAMWFTRDVMYMQLLHETMARSDKSTGGKMSVEEGVAKVERHLPNYRMPEKVLGSRGLSKALQNPNIAVFSRYHYGMLKSIANTLKDIHPKNLKTLEGRKDFREGVDSILAISVAMAVLYPLMDKLAQAITGDDEAEMRRAGPYHLYHAGEQVVKGEKDLSALVYPIFTFNPMLLTLGQALYNKNLFSGKEIYHPQDPVGDQLTDAAKYFVKQAPQAPGLMGVGGGDSQATTSYIAKQLDVQSKTDKQREAERTARKRAAAQAKGRATRREKGTL